MRRVLLAPKWLVGHVLVLVVAVAFCRLGWWQWGRYRQTQGGLQYLSYAVQWPVFAAFGVAMWARIVRDSLRPPAAAPQPPHRAGPRLRPAAGPTVANPALPGAAQPEPDDELAAYNRYLASLYERDRQEQR